MMISLGYHPSHRPGDLVWHDLDTLVKVVARFGPWTVVMPVKHPPNCECGCN